MSDGDLYFLSNRNAEKTSLSARFRVTGKAAQIWRTDTGAITPAAFSIVGGETIVPLEMKGGESFFVVFREPAAAPTRTVPEAQRSVVGDLAGPWTVAFQPSRGAPAKARLEALGSLSEQADPGIKYFSGVATYTKDFTARRPAAQRTLLLDLGAVGDVAEVRVNGALAGGAWKPRISLISATWCGPAATRWRFGWRTSGSTA